MLIFILIDVQYSQKAVEKGSNCSIKISNPPTPATTTPFCYLENPESGTQYLFEINFANNS